MNATLPERCDSPQAPWMICACGDPDCRTAFAELASVGAASDGRLRNQLVERHLRLAYSIAARYRFDPRVQDIRQVAALALVEAVDRFDPRRGTPFSAFATPTVAGTLKRFLRDNRWTLRTPRGAGELLLQMTAAREILTQRLGRDPRDREFAGALQCTEAEIVSVRRMAHEQHMLSLDGPATAGVGDRAVGDTLAEGADALAGVDDREALYTELQRLPERQLRVVMLYYYADLTQREIAAQIGVSQMQVSRLLKSALQQLRTGMLPDVDGGPENCDSAQQRHMQESGERDGEARTEPPADAAHEHGEAARAHQPVVADAEPDANGPCRNHDVARQGHGRRPQTDSRNLSRTVDRTRYRPPSSARHGGPPRRAARAATGRARSPHWPVPRPPPAEAFHPMPVNPVEPLGHPPSGSS
ncbi:sigma-70 family RNA polymerase sigma factor [Dactylosporangium aurantiacum]|uniref:Sigma-70 family RNA polymerase sigma factor n=1 Tax=Dactylosporangium aurantiacum TaxID=35754 RepID=A0A9Q9MRL4_9ACTN|nr:sigma-70 family RNA polymerase sigma factor [Dactylosporangium aurantiacum]MDG6110329.1 sigma-70 family RNA polymerase sigma factor [Dactylosporangium aurantiacum]UWZ58617.1 sigma-70 family RNA polymerase sigma factor [Dactylosporangium aurantiacum]